MYSGAISAASSYALKKFTPSELIHFKTELCKLARAIALVFVMNGLFVWLVQENLVRITSKIR